MHARRRTCCVTNIAFDTRVIEFSVRSGHEPSERAVISRLIPTGCYPTKRTDRVVDQRVERAYIREYLWTVSNDRSPLYPAGEGTLYIAPRGELLPVGGDVLFRRGC